MSCKRLSILGSSDGGETQQQQGPPQVSGVVVVVRGSQGSNEGQREPFECLRFMKVLKDCVPSSTWVCSGSRRQEDPSPSAES